MTHSGGEQSDMAPSALLRRYFGEFNGRMCDLKFVAMHLEENPGALQAEIDDLDKPAGWCPCGNLMKCECFGNKKIGETLVLDAIRFAILRLETMCKVCVSTCTPSLMTRIAMIAYLPLTRVWDVRSLPLTVEESAELVNMDTCESIYTLPNIRDVVLNVEFWRTDPIYKAKTVQAMLAHVLGKVLPARCHLRNLRYIAMEYCMESDKPFNKFVHQVVRCCLFGIFPGSSAPSNFSYIQNVDRLETPPSGMENDIGEFACRHDFLLFHAFKELLIMFVDGIPPLKKVLDSTYKWYAFTKQVRATNSRFRLRLNSITCPQEMDLVNLNEFAKTLTKQHVKNMHRIRKDTIPEYLASALKLEKHELACTNMAVATEKYESFNVATAQKAMVERFDIDARFAKIVSDGILRFYTTGFPCKQMAKVLGSVDFNFDQLSNIAQYCKVLHASSTFSFARLSNETRKWQIEALRERYCIVREDLTDEELHKLTISPMCMTCGSWKAPMAPLKSVIARKPHDYVGCQNIVINGSTMQKYCSACHDNSVLWYVPILGLAVRNGRDVFILCTLCAAVTTLNPLNVIGRRNLCVSCFDRVRSALKGPLDMRRVCVVDGCQHEPPPQNSQHFNMCDDMDANKEFQSVDGLPMLTNVAPFRDAAPVRTFGVCSAHKRFAEHARKQTKSRARLNEIVKAVIEKNGQMRANENKMQMEIDEEDNEWNRRKRSAHQISSKTLMKRFRTGKL
jgi:hypothetical protein